MTRPHILFHRPTPWFSAIQCSTKTLARLFCEAGCDVTYLPAPLDLGHVLRPRAPLADWRAGVRMDGGVRVLAPATPVPVRDIWPLDTATAAGLRYRAAWPPLRSAVADGGRQPPDVVWTTVPGSGPALRTLFPEARLIFHVVDYYPAFRGPAVAELERRDYAAADQVLLIGESLRGHVVEIAGASPEKVSVLGQGVDLERYEGPAPAPDDLAALPRPRAVWSGVLAKGDPGLFDRAADAMRACRGSLALIGPTAAWAVALAKRAPETVALLGPRPAFELPAYLLNCDLGLMLYARSRAAVYRGQNPLKLYEYAAAGLPILSTPHDEFAHLAPPVLEIGDEAAVAPAVREALARADGLRSASRAFAARHSWRSKVAAMRMTLFESAGLDPEPRRSPAA